MYDRLIAFLDKWSILYQYQFGFRNNHSTYMALIFLMDKIISVLNDGDYVLGLFLDLPKLLIPLIIIFFLTNWNFMGSEEMHFVGFKAI